MSTQSTKPPRNILSKFWHNSVKSVVQWLESWLPSSTKSPADVALDVGKKAFLVATIVVSTSVPAFFGEIFEWGIISGFWQFFWGTVPLIISIALIIPFTLSYFISVEPRKNDFQSNYTRLATWAFVVVGILWAMAWITGSLGLGAGQAVQQRVAEAERAHTEACIGYYRPDRTTGLPGGGLQTQRGRYVPPAISCRNDWLYLPTRLVWNYSSAYVEVYGLWTSFCCLIVGLFIDWAILVMLPPLLNSRRQRQSASP
jgi:hypothetical protein